MSRARFIAGLTGDKGTASQIIFRMCQFYGVTQRQLLSAGKLDRKVSIARQATYHALHEALGNNSEVARIMRKDHTTVLHGIKAHQARINQQQGKEST